ncbi:MAG: S-methyl-5-thioribose-1-phosphate isomerase [Pseudomonadota bacterium]
MKTMNSMGLRYEDQSLSLLDQTMLPGSEVWLRIESLEQMDEAIKSLRTRGAPLIGVAASLYLGMALEKGMSTDEFIRQAAVLRESRPTAVNLMNAIDSLVALAKSGASSEELIAKIEILFQQDVDLCQRMGANGAEVVNSGDGILTHCNTGGLATVGIGTALGVIQTAHEQGKNIHVYVDETRPLLQGGRLTTYELEKLGVPYTLICDNMAARLMRDGQIQKAFVGADRIALNGDFANKTGTYSVAVACKAHNIPFYAVAPVTTVDFECQSGDEIPIEERVDFEVKGVRGSFGEAMWAPENANVYNPAFDVTPADLVSGWVFDTNLLSQAEVAEGAIAQLRSN